MSRQTVLAARTAQEQPDTTEIQALAEAAGFEVTRILTQTRPEDATYNLGPGKVDEVADAVRETGASTVIVDNRLTPAQLFELTDRLPDGTEVRDRYRLILDIFEAGAQTKRAQLQVELARLRHELHHRREEQRRNEEWQGLQTIRDPEGEWIREVKQRIDRAQNRLNDLPDDPTAPRDRKREDGFDFVALAGYTNAGKSTLLHRLADDLSIDETPAHADLGDGTAAVEDRLFKTLDTTTRRATIEGRRVLVSDTVGFVRDLPHDLVEAFRSTLTEVRNADVVVLAVDASDGVREMRERIETCRAELDTDATVVTAFTKADLTPEEEIRRKAAELADVAPDPVPVSAVEDAGLETLRERVVEPLPTESATFEIPNSDESMRFVSWCYEHATVGSIEYGERVRLTLSGRPPVVAKARSRADDRRRERRTACCGTDRAD
ncbi:GTPase HflX [Haloarchaeobius sp. TZWWS8]|uniref:GTPase HflX n=1 Tax=Haloarchaeobius sp. TZWWS8 TaxID=3446121 RepID=UPI003EB77DB8